MMHKHLVRGPDAPPTRMRLGSRGSLNSDVTKLLELQATAGNRALQTMMRPRSTRSVQRFTEAEHKVIGDEATQGEHGELESVVVGDERLSYGDMVAMADHFESMNQIRMFAANSHTTGPGTVEEIRYVLSVKIRQQRTAESFFVNGRPSAAMTAADRRYTRMALDNAAHFPNPRTGDEDRSVEEKAEDIDADTRLPTSATGGYRKYHEQALNEAFHCGRRGKSIETAMAAEAFAAHYLTDSFSGGHVRSARASVKEYWHSRVPMFNANLSGYIANEMAKALQGSDFWTSITTTDQLYQDLPPVLSWFGDDALTLVRSKLATMGVMTFGDVVGRVIHDYDNKHGVAATIEGQDVVLYGDDKLGTGDEKMYAVRAVQLSHADVVSAWNLGKSRLEFGVEQFQRDGVYAAEELLPTAKPDSEQPPEGPIRDSHTPGDRASIEWRVEHVDTLLNDPKFREGFALFIDSYAGMIGGVGKSLGAAQAAAFESVIMKPLLDPGTQIGTLRKIIDWVPDTGGGWFGHKQDDNVMDYYHLAQKEKALGTLTLEQKRRIIRQLLDGATVGEDEDAIVRLLETNHDDAKTLIREFGWGRLHDEIDDWAGNEFEEAFPRVRAGGQ